MALKLAQSEAGTLRVNLALACTVPGLHLAAVVGQLRPEVGCACFGDDNKVEETNALRRH